MNERLLCDIVKSDRNKVQNSSNIKKKFLGYFKSTRRFAVHNFSDNE